MLNIKNKTAVSLLLFFTLILVNSSIAAFLGAALRFDISARGMYTLTDPTKKMLNNLGTDVTLNVLNADGSEKMLDFFYEGYDKYSDKISLNYAGAEEFSEYFAEMGVSPDDVPAYSLIISSEYRNIFVYSGALYNVYFDGKYYELGEFDSFIQQAYMYYQQYYPDALAAFLNQIKTDAYECFRGEQVLSKYIEQASIKLIPHSYLLTDKGGDAAWLGVFADYMAGFGTEDLSLSETGAIPADANTLIIASPDEDLTDGETALILEFLKAGGGLTVFTSEKNNSHANLMSILEYYGMTLRGEGLAGKDLPAESKDGKEEEETESEPEKTNELTVKLNIDNDIYSAIDPSKFLFKIKDANAIRLSKNMRSSLLVYDVFTTESDVYLGDDKNTVGTHIVAAAAEEVVTGGVTRVVWYTGAESFTAENAGDTMPGVSGFSLRWMTDTFKSAVASVKPVLLDKTAMEVSSADVIIISVLLIGVMPVSILFIGFSINQKRKNV